MMDSPRFHQYPLILQSTFVAGFILGGYQPARQAAIQFYAEHQHNPPRTNAEAVVYYRRRNYKVMAAFGRAGVVRGVQVAAVGAVWVLGDFVMQPVGNEIVRGMVAGATSGSLMGLAGRGHRLYYARRGALLGGGLGAGLGLLQTAMNLVDAQR